MFLKKYLINNTSIKNISNKRWSNFKTVFKISRDTCMRVFQNSLIYFLFFIFLVFSIIHCKKHYQSTFSSFYPNTNRLSLKTFGVEALPSKALITDKSALTIMTPDQLLAWQRRTITAQSLYQLTKKYITRYVKQNPHIYVYIHRERILTGTCESLAFLLASVAERTV